MNKTLEKKPIFDQLTKSKVTIIVVHSFWDLFGRTRKEKGPTIFFHKRLTRDTKYDDWNQ